MKLLISLAFFAVVAQAFIFPNAPAGDALQELSKFMGEEELNKEPGNFRAPRVICDLLSIGYRGIHLETVLCAAKCYRQHHHGGHCEHGACVCSH